ncbi:MAG: hypothetical protein RIG82_10275 [Phycisphaeraceae bacterium]
MLILRIGVLVVCLVLVPGLSRMVVANPVMPDPSVILVPERATAIMPVDEVRPGMRGVCLTVFSGTNIEPFEVEVLSVVKRSGPGLAVIWLRSEDPRMLESGPVQGMSGSPIYLWDGPEPNDPEAELGGGRLIGAFAYGFAFAKGCLIGVQPIEQMIPVGERIGRDPVDYAQASARALGDVRRMMRALGEDSERESVRASTELWEQLLKRWTLVGTGRRLEAGDVQRPMSIPVAGVPEGLLSAGLPMGGGEGLLRFVAGGGAVGPPPQWIDREAPITAGSVLAIPLTTGDLDLAGVGTVTDVRPDGTVLAFGHAMMGEGSTALPMASGYVHFIVPSLQISFKRGTPLRVAGTLMQDETTAVAGRGSIEHVFADMKVDVQMDGQPDRAYAYQIARHPLYTPILSLICAAQSLTAIQTPPAEHTMDYRMTIGFQGGRSVEVSNTTAGGGFEALFSTVVPVIGMGMSNPFEQLRLASVEMALEVRRGLDAGMIEGVRFERNVVAPGEEAVILVDLLPYRGELRTVRITLPVPENAGEMDVPVMVGGIGSYRRLWMQTRMHRFDVDGVDELFDVIETMENLPAMSLYATATMPASGGVAMDGAEMRDLPGSVSSQIMTATSTRATMLPKLIESRLDTGLEVSGEVMLTLSIRKP